MKKIINKINMFIIAMMVSAPAFAAASKTDSAICDLMKEMGGIFNSLRILAFAGAAFTIAGWAWGFISKGEVKLEEVKNKGIGLLVGFMLLFGIGTFLTFFITAYGNDSVTCGGMLSKW